MRATPVPIRLLSVVLLAFAVGCGGGHGGNYNGSDGGSQGGGGDGGTQSGARRLAVVGNPLVQLQIGGKADLTVGLVQENLGAVSGATVTYTIVGTAAGSTLTATTATTDSKGSATVSLDAGKTQTTFQVKVTSPGASPVAFGVQIIKLNQTITILKTPSVTPDSSATAATVQTSMKTKVNLEVRITDQFGNPMTGLAVHFGFAQNPSTATLVNSGTAPTTGPAGQATQVLDTGTTLNDSFTITARTDSSATATWTVNISGAGILLCKTDSDCPQGQICDTTTGECKGAPACNNTSDPPIPCPQGYQCNNGECAPVFTAGCATNADCGPGYTCDTSTGTCQANNPQCGTGGKTCPTGYTCTGGTCAPPDVPVPDISGTWYTAHTFHIADALGVLGSLAGPLRTIDQLLLGDLGLPGWLNNILQGLINKYIPSWVKTVVHILDVVETFFQDLRARGYMTIQQSKKTNGDPAPAWTATEQWQSFVFYDLDQCNPIPSNPTPPCARVDLMVNDPTKIATLGLDVHPFAGTINGSVTPPQIVVNERTVDLHVGKLVGWLADKLVSLFTQYTSVQDALVNVVDCQALSDAINNWTNGLTGDLTGVCKSAVAKVAQQIENALYNITFKVGALTFKGTANITTDSSTPPYGTALGDANFETTKDGSYTGSFVLKPLSFPGWWYASRDPLP